MHIPQTGVENDQIAVGKFGLDLRSSLSLIPVGQMSEIRVEVHGSNCELAAQRNPRPLEWRDDQRVRSGHSGLNGCSFGNWHISKFSGAAVHRPVEKAGSFALVGSYSQQKRIHQVASPRWVFAAARYHRITLREVIYHRQLKRFLFLFV